MKVLPRIRGGLTVPRDKPGLDAPIVTIAVPATLVYPLSGHGGRALAPAVAPGERVALGTPLADGVRATHAGTVRSIERAPVLDRHRTSAECLFIDTDTGGATATHTTHGDAWAHGIAGFGGAAFPVADKLAALHRAGGCRLLVVNACECEPGIACDEALLQHDAPSVVAALRAVIGRVQPDAVVIAIEADKRYAIGALRSALEVARAHDVSLVEIAPVYPSGAERPLVELLLHERGLPRLPAAQRPTDAGVLCSNVATIHALGQAIAGKPGATRLVSVSGSHGRSATACVTLGTPLLTVLEQLAPFIGAFDAATQRVRIGGPLSGYLSDAIEAPVSIATHAVAFTDRAADRAEESRPCIRCGDCAAVCPVELQPQLLHWHALAADTAALERQGLEQCIECGCCDVVCPSRLPLTAQFTEHRRHARTLAARQAQADRADALHRRKTERLARPLPAAAAPVVSAGSVDVDAALQRVKARARRRRSP